MFASVYEKHYFAELFFLGQSTKMSLPAVIESKSAKGEKDLRLLVMTWNQGGKDVDGFANLHRIIPNLQDYDIVVFASQECKKKNRVSRAIEINNFMQSKCFVNIDKDFEMVYMYEMFMSIFVKMDHVQDVNSVV